MEQLSFFADSVPATYEDVFAFYKSHITPPSPDADAFTCSEDELSSGSKSFFAYGQKVFEFIPAKGKFRLFGSWLRKLEPASGKDYEDDNLYVCKLTPDKLSAFADILQSEIKTIFRNTCEGLFCCCNDFRACSDAKECIHQTERFYNGCSYRLNLEAGRIFYGKNTNV